MRYALGMVAMFAVVFTFNWPAAFLVILIGNGFLLGPKPTLKFAFDFIFKFTLAWLIAVIISYLFLDYYILYILIIGLIMLHVYYADSSVLSPILKVAMCIMNMLVPLMSLKSLVLGTTVGSLLVIGSIGALLISFIVFALIPDIEPPASQAKSSPAAPPAPAPKPSPKERFNLAIRSLAVLFPLLILFFFSNFQGDALILVYIALFASMPGFANDLSIGKMMIRTTLIGGLIAFFMYEILVIIPLFSFFMLMVFGLALFAGHQLFTSGKFALTIKKGFSAIIFIFGGAANSNEVDVGGKVGMRVLQMTILVVYLVLAFKLLEKFFPQMKKSTLR